MSFQFFSSPGRPSDEAARQAAVDALRHRGITDPESLGELVAEAARGLDCPIALASIIDGDTQRVVQAVGLPVADSPRAISFCAHAIQEGGVLHVPDALIDPRFMGNPYVTGPLNLRFYAGVPLRVSNGSAVGALCVIDIAPRVMSGTDIARLRVLAERAAKAL